MAFQFQDYGPEDVWKKWAFALEAEIAVQDAADWNKMTGTNLFRKYTSRIWESERAHELEGWEKLRLMDFLRKNYDYHIPFGADSYLSGGNHFHIFFNEETYDFWRNFNKANKFEAWFKYAPLYAKYHEWVWFNRRNFRATPIGTIIPNWSKCASVTLKNYYTGGCPSGTRSLEFRLNNVLDARLYGYYLWMMLTVAFWVEPVEPTEWKQKFGLLYNGNFKDYQNIYGANYVPEEITVEDRDDDDDDDDDGYSTSETVQSVEKLDIRKYPQHGFTVDNEIVKANCKTILSILEQFNMVKAKEALEEYLYEKNILSQ